MTGEAIGEGAYVRPDAWRCGERLRADLEGFAPFRLEGAHADYAVRRVEVTGRGRRLHRASGTVWVRVRVLFAGDGEPDEAAPGWARVA